MSRRSEGSVYQRHDHDTCTDGPHRCSGHWVAAVTVNGKRVVRYRRTKREALDELRRMLAQRDTLTNDRTTVAAWLDHWLATTAATRVRESTLRGYTSKVEQYLKPTLGKKRLTALRPHDLERMYADMIGRGLSPRTVAQTHAILHQAIGKAVKAGLVASNVADLADKPPVRREPPTVFDPAALRTILATAAGDRMEARWWVALTLGLRQGEALGLTWDDVNLDGPQPSVTVRHSLQRGRGGLGHVLPKSAAGYRTVPMSRAMTAVLRRHRDRQEGERVRAANVWANDLDLVFTQDTGRPVGPESDNRAWHALLTKAGQPSVKLHAARHTAITMWLLAGVPLHTAKVWAGHASIQITSDTYGGVVAQMHEQGLAALEGIYVDTASALTQRSSA